MNVFITPDHDTSLIDNDRITKLIELSEETELSEEEINELVSVGIQGEYDLYESAHGDDYADCVMSDLIMD